MGCHDDDAGVVVLLPDLPDHLQPIHFRHVDVGNHQVGFHLIEDLKSGLAVFSNMKILHDALNYRTVDLPDGSLVFGIKY